MAFNNSCDTTATSYTFQITLLTTTISCVSCHLHTYMCVCVCKYALHFFNFRFCVFFVWFFVFKWHKFNFILVKNPHGCRCINRHDSGYRTVLSTNWWFSNFTRYHFSSRTVTHSLVNLLTVIYGLSFHLTRVSFFVGLFVLVWAL